MYGLLARARLTVTSTNARTRPMRVQAGARRPGTTRALVNRRATFSRKSAEKLHRAQNDNASGDKRKKKREKKYVIPLRDELNRDVPDSRIADYPANLAC